MKLTSKQKELLNNIENKNLRKEIKKEFKKIQPTMYVAKRKFLEEPKTKKISELPLKTFDFSSAKLSQFQINKVIEWMNAWEQLKDTAIPIRFAEDFRAKDFDDFDDASDPKRNFKISEIVDKVVELSKEKLEFDLPKSIEQFLFTENGIKFKYKEAKNLLPQSNVSNLTYIGGKYYEKVYA